MNSAAVATVDERLARVAFSLLPEVGPVRFSRLEELFGSAAGVFAASTKDWAAVEGVGEALAPEVYRRLQESLLKARADLSEAGRRGIRVVIPGEADYPAPLKQLRDAPTALYVRGEWRPEDAGAVAVVGTRRPTPYGIAATERLVKGLSQAGVTVVSGLARGIDTAAHRAALAAGGRTVAVLGSGLERMYPPENESLAGKTSAQGAVLSEFPLRAPPDKPNFPRRNRLISGLSRAVVVVEADEKSGALLTAQWAADQGKDVMAVPGSVFSERSRGPHKLLKAGAVPVEDARDVLDFLGAAVSQTPGRHTPRKDAKMALTPEEDSVMKYLSLEPTHHTTLAQKASLDASEVAVALVGLELKGLIKTLPGQRVVAQAKDNQ